MSLSKLTEKCAKCKYKDICDEKRMAACAYCEHPPLIADAAQEVSQPLLQPILQKHDYRNIKIDANTTITIDLEDLKRQLEKSHFPSLLMEAT